MTTEPIRPMRRADLARVRYLVEANEMFPPEMLEEMSAPFFGGDSGHRWLVFDDGAVDGAAYFVPEELADGVWNLLMIAIDPARHGGGVGTRLMAFVEGALVAEGHRMLLVETSGADAFARTRAFYDRMGYEREAVIRDYWAPGEDKVTFRKLLG